MKNFAFRQYRRSSKEKEKEENSNADSTEPKDKESAAYQKRREQVRRAQRTHRERKENYTRNLEDQVLRLLSNEISLAQRNNHLEQEVDRLKQLLEHNGISHLHTPTQLPSPATTGSDWAHSVSTVSVLQSPSGAQQLHVGGVNGDSRLWLAESEGSQVSKESGTQHKAKSLFGMNQRQEGTDMQSSVEHAVPIDPTRKMRDLDQTDLGMEFVLTLEAICLDHIQSHESIPETQGLAPTGHALMTSAAVLEESPQQPVDLASGTQWNIPRLGMENLLDLSRKIDFDGDLAPVQAWARLRERSGFEDLELGQLRALTHDMLKEMKCRGFGAVIDVETFETLAEKVLPCRRTTA